MSAQTRGLFRWAGGKARIVETLFAHIDADAHELCPPCVAPHRAPAARWLEPFVGSGAMALAAMRRGIAREYVCRRATRHRDDAARWRGPKRGALSRRRCRASRPSRSKNRSASSSN